MFQPTPFLILGLNFCAELNEDLICWVGSWNCRGYSVIGICFVFSLVDANSFVLVSWYFDIWNLFLREFVFAGATLECSFCRVSWTYCTNCIGEVMVWIAIRWEKCLSDFPETPSLCLFGIRVCFLSSGWWKDQQRVKRSWARFSSRKANEKADIWRGFLSSLGLFWFLVSRLETIYEDRFYLKLWNPKLT